jgi:arylsulfatase A-like enzyme
MGASSRAWRSVGAAAALVLTGFGCSAAEPRRPNVVVVLIDQLRKDSSDRHLTRVNALAERGVVFDEMRAAAPWTYPSVISLLSGLYPQQHGADGHATDNRLSHFDPAVPLLQKRLKAVGYATAAFVTNSFLLDWNAFHLGFDTFASDFVRSQGDGRGDEGTWAPETMFADSVNRAVRAHFDARPQPSPEFTYIHYIDVHGPWRRAPFAPHYENAIRYVDAKVVELYEYFSERYAGDLLFFVTSDHGRSTANDLDVGYGPAWRKQKASVHDFNLRIPFLILPSRWIPQARRIAGPSSSVDFAPTLLDWLDLPPEAPLPGLSLLPAILEGEALPPERPIYARHSAFEDYNDGVVRGDRKYVRFFDVGTGEIVERRVFDVRRDPRETRSVDHEFGEQAATVESVSGTQGVAYKGVFREVDADVEAQLRALGYLDDER